MWPYLGRSAPIAFRLAIALVIATLTVGGLSAGRGDAQPVTTLGIDHDRGTPNVNSGPVVLGANTLASVALVTENVPAPGLGAWDIRIHYDSNVIAPVICETYEPPNNNFCLINSGPETVRVLAVSVIGQTGDLVLADTAFRAVGTPGECSTLAIEIDQFADANGTDLVPDVSQGEVCVVSGLPTPTAIVGLDHDGDLPADIDAGPLLVPIDFQGTFRIAADSPNGVSSWIVNVEYDDSIVEVEFCGGAALCHETGPPPGITFVGNGNLSPFESHFIGGVTFLPLGEIGECAPLTVSVLSLSDLLGQQISSTAMHGEVCIGESFFPTPTPTPGPEPGTTPRPPAVGGIAGLAPNDTAVATTADRGSDALLVPLVIALASALALATVAGWRVVAVRRRS